MLRVSFIVYATNDAVVKFNSSTDLKLQNYSIAY